MQIVVVGGPLWLQYVIGIGTAGAALFAGFAAWATRTASRASRDLVQVETGRDGRRAEETRWQQARRITVDCVLSQAPTALGGRQRAYDTAVRVMNVGRDPITKVRVKIDVGDASWGPQLVGSIGPGDHVEIIARLVTSAANPDADAYARFTDALGETWVASVQDPVRPDDLTTERWIEEGRMFAARYQSLTAEERGSVTGVFLPEFDRWRSDMAGQ